MKWVHMSHAKSQEHHCNYTTSLNAVVRDRSHAHRRILYIDLLFESTKTLLSSALSCLRAHCYLLRQASSLVPGAEVTKNTSHASHGPEEPLTLKMLYEQAAYRE